MRRAQFLVRSLVAAVGLPFGAESAAAARVPEARALRVAANRRRFRGDGPTHVSVSPFTRGREQALVRFELTGRARVRLDALRTDTIRVGKPLGEVVWSTERTLGRGAHELVWRPSRALQPRTYLLRLTVSAGGKQRVYGMHRPGQRSEGPVVRVLGVDVATTKASYAPGESADLLIASDARELELQVFHYAGAERFVERDLRTNGVAVTPSVRVDWRAHTDAPSRLRLLRAGGWASGLYFARARAADG